MDSKEHRTDSFASYRDGVLLWRLLQQLVGWHGKAALIATWAGSLMNQTQLTVMVF